MCGRLAPGAGVSHRQRRRDAIRGEEKVTIFQGNGVEEIIGKLGVTGNQLVQGSWSNVDGVFLAYFLREGHTVIGGNSRHKN